MFHSVAMLVTGLVILMGAKKISPFDRVEFEVLDSVRDKYKSGLIALGWFNVLGGLFYAFEYYKII